MSDSIRIAGVQMDVRLGDKANNLDRIEQFLHQAVDQGAKLVVFPECAVSGYCFESLEEARQYAELVPGPAVERLAAVCEARNAFLVAGLLEAEEDKVYNAAVAVGPDGLIGCYRKAHLPGLGVDHFTSPGPGEGCNLEDAFPVWEMAGLRIGVNICYDGSFPEASRVMTLAGADLIVLPTNWPEPARSFAEHVINARALENNVYYLSADRIGEERGFRFIGISRLCDPSAARWPASTTTRKESFSATFVPTSRGRSGSSASRAATSSTASPTAARSCTAPWRRVWNERRSCTYSFRRFS